jgi:peptide/nickel transport system substrate-binding protein
MRGRRWRFLAGSLVVALAGAACSGGAKTTTPTATVKPGGTLRVGLSSFGFSDGMDPTGEYTSPGWGMLTPMLRVLVTYKFADGAAGLEIVPDLATEVPKPSADGLSYVFHLKPGVKFGPPLDRPVTSKDVEYAFERINTASLAAQYGFYYDGVIEGMTGAAKKPEPISGIETPDDSTIIFHLTAPTGDFLSRVSMPATAAIPPEVAGCFTTPGSYARDLVSSGPYIIQGAGDVDVSSCKAIEPMAGFDPTKQLTLVRNPDYSAETDAQSGRRNYPNAIELTVDTSVTDIFDRIQSGTYDTSYYDTPPATVLQRYTTTPSLKDRLISTKGGLTEYFQMNLTVPPFDDIHVRKAVNWILDKEAILKTWGGSLGGQIATHLIPPIVLGNVSGSQFNLYPTPGNAGSLEKAQAEMKLSKYDTNKDGMCDGSVCGKIVLINQNIAPFTDMEPIIQSDLAKIGLQISPRELQFGSAFNTIQTVKNQIPAQTAVPWVYDYPDAFPYDKALFDSGSIFPQGNENMSLVGLSPETAKKLGVPYPESGIPNVDADIAKCENLPIGVGSQRNDCWAALEQHLMNDVVPVAPLVWFNSLNVFGADVTHWEGTPQQGVNLVNIAVSNTITPGSG